MDSEIWLPLATLIGGAVLAYIAQSRLSARQYEREKESDERQYEREQERRRREWQRQVTIDLLDAFAELHRATMGVYVEGEIDASGLRMPLDTELLKDEMQPAISRCHVLATLIADSELSVKTRNAITTMFAAAIAPGTESPDQSMEDITDAYIETISKLGKYAQSL